MTGLLIVLLPFLVVICWLACDYCKQTKVEALAKKEEDYGEITAGEHG